MARWLGLIALAAASVCATTASGGPPGRRVQSISYETGPCFGACPVYTLTVGADGSGTFEGRSYTPVIGRRTFRVTPRQYRDFVRLLEPLRPSRGTVRYEGESCRMLATDLPSTHVKWRAADGSEQELHFSHGCDMERNRRIEERLDNALEALPVSELINPEFDRS